MYGVGRLFSEKLHKAHRLPGVLAKHADRGRIDALDCFCFIYGNNARGNIFEDRFHQRAPPLQLLHRLLQVLRENVDLSAAVAELFRHPIE